MNQFTDLIQEEFVARYLTTKLALTSGVEPSQKRQPIGKDIDWVASGKVSAVKNQGTCGSGWAFGTVASIESFGLFTNPSQQPLS